MSDWISTKKALPGTETKGGVLAAVNSDGVSITMCASYSNGNWEFTVFDDEGIMELHLDVTHWMPLPEPPEVE